MAYQVQSDTLYADVYEKICDVIKADPKILELADGVVFDFDLPVATDTPTQPRDCPRIYVLPSQVEYPGATSCCNQLILNYSIVIDGFHIRDPKANKMAFRMMFLMRNIPFTSIDIDGYPFGVICVPGSGSWDYDSSRQTMAHTIGLTVNIYV